MARESRHADVVVVGAGHHGLVAALVLREAGLSVTVVEGRRTVGGRARSERSFGPTFLHSPHATALWYEGLSDFLRVGELRPEGLRVVEPTVVHGLAFADGRPPVSIVRAAGPGTLPELCGGTRSDRVAFSALMRRQAATRVMAAQVMNGPPELAVLRESVQRSVDLFADILPGTGAAGTTADLLAGLFESQAVRVLLARLCLELGGSLDDPGSAVGFLSSVLPLVGQVRLPMGGMQSVSDALAVRARARGVGFQLGTTAARVLVNAGRATGVQLVDGRRVTACEGVLLATGDPNVVGEASATSPPAGGAQAASVAVHLREPPRYTSARWDPRLDTCAQVFFGLDDLAAVRRHEDEIAAGALPEPAGVAKVGSLWDPSQAPTGAASATVDCAFPAGIEVWTDWPDVQGAFGAALVETWARYAPNVSAATLAARLNDPAPGLRAVGVGGGAAAYRGRLARLYRGDSTVHPGGGVNGIAGGLAAWTLLADLGLRPAADRATDPPTTSHFCAPPGFPGSGSSDPLSRRVRAP